MMGMNVIRRNVVNTINLFLREHFQLSLIISKFKRMKKIKPESFLEMQKLSALENEYLMGGKRVIDENGEIKKVKSKFHEE